MRAAWYLCDTLANRPHGATGTSSYYLFSTGEVADARGGHVTASHSQDAHRRSGARPSRSLTFIVAGELSHQAWSHIGGVRLFQSVAVPSAVVPPCLSVWGIVYVDGGVVGLLPLA